MKQIKSIIDMKDYGKVNVNLKNILKEKGITRNKLRTITGIKYDVIDRYYKNENIERVDLDFIAKVCYCLNCRVEDVLTYDFDEK